MATSVQQPDSKSDIDLSKIVVRFVLYLIILAVITFGLAGRLDWGMAWAFLGVFTVMTFVSLTVVPLDRELIEERTQVKAGVKAWDKPIAIIGSILFPLGTLIVAGLDMRYGWSASIPLRFQIAALAVVIGAHLLMIWAATSNKFYARFVRIQTERGHTVVSSGPYQYVRHPGYVGSALYMLAAPFALGSVWALAPSLVMVPLLVVRTALEDKTLREELDGYEAYTQRVRYRLLPGIW